MTVRDVVVARIRLSEHGELEVHELHQHDRVLDVLCLDDLVDEVLAKPFEGQPLSLHQADHREIDVAVIVDHVTRFGFGRELGDALAGLRIDREHPGAEVERCSECWLLTGHDDAQLVIDTDQHVWLLLHIIGGQDFHVLQIGQLFV